MAAAARRPPRWAWSAARCWATASRPTATAPRVYESYRVSIQTDNGAYRAFDVPSPGDLRVGDRVRIDNGQISRI